MRILLALLLLSATPSYAQLLWTCPTEPAATGSNEDSLCPQATWQRPDKASVVLVLRKVGETYRQLWERSTALQAGDRVYACANVPAGSTAKCPARLSGQPDNWLRDVAWPAESALPVTVTVNWAKVTLDRAGQPLPTDASYVVKYWPDKPNVVPTEALTAAPPYVFKVSGRTCVEVRARFGNQDGDPSPRWCGDAAEQRITVPGRVGELSVTITVTPSGPQ